VFVPGKLYKPNLINTSLVQKSVNDGCKSFIILTPGRICRHGQERFLLLRPPADQPRPFRRPRWSSRLPRRPSPIRSLAFRPRRSWRQPRRQLAFRRRKFFRRNSLRQRLCRPEPVVDSIKLLYRFIARLLIEKNLADRHLVDSVKAQKALKFVVFNVFIFTPFI